MLHITDGFFPMLQWNIGDIMVGDTASLSFVVEACGCTNPIGKSFLYLNLYLRCTYPAKIFNTVTHARNKFIANQSPCLLNRRTLKKTVTHLRFYVVYRSSVYA